MSILFKIIILSIICECNAFRQVFQPHDSKFSSSALFYDYFKKSAEKKEIGRIWKNIIFPGIFVEYEDTKEPKPTIKIESKPVIKETGRGEVSPELRQGTYQAVDPSQIPELSGQMVVEKKLKPIAKPKSFVAPTPKKATTIALGVGLSVLPDIKKFPRPKKPLILYEYESNNDCKKVREACTLLDLIIECRPCPGASAGFSDLQNTITNGRRTVPFLIDNNPSMYKPQLFGSKDIVEYLFDTYGPSAKQIPANLKSSLSPAANTNKASSGGLFGVFSSDKGTKLRKNARPDTTKLKPITLYGWEGAPFVKQVRETLTELGLAHIFINCANGSLNRNALSQRTKGIFQVPYIIDPNTNVEMFESAEIVKYLEEVYTI